MLSSHMKSHSAVHRYRCTHCTYATKYEHLLEQHLERFEHRANETANLLHNSSDNNSASPAVSPQTNNTAEMTIFSLALAGMLHNNHLPTDPQNRSYSPLDLSTVERLSEEAPLVEGKDQLIEDCATRANTQLSAPSNKHIKRGLAIEGIAVSLMSQAQAQPPSPKVNDGFSLECKTCGIAFRDRNLYEIHAKYHSVDEPLMCCCGFRASDAVHFFTHLNQQAHPVSHN